MTNKNTIPSPQTLPESRLSQASSIAELAQRLDQDPDTAHQEIPVWGVGIVDAEPGKVAAISTAGLNGCHVSVITGKDAAGKRTLAMTHFPPGLAKERYKRSVQELSAALEDQAITVDQVVTVVDSRRLPEEVSVLSDCFPNSNIAEMTYDSRAVNRNYLEDKGQVLAVVDFRNPAEAQIHIATEIDSQTLALTA